MRSNEPNPCAPHTQILDCANLLRLRQPLIKRDRIGVIIHLLVLPQITFERSEDHSDARAIIVDLGDPLRTNVLERIAAVDLHTPISSLLAWLAGAGPFSILTLKQSMSTCVSS